MGGPAHNKQTLAEVLTARARAASDGRLVLNSVGGIVVIAAAVFWRPPAALFVIAVGTCFVAYGVWGIAQRELDERGGAAGTRARVILVGIRTVATCIAAVALGVVLFALLATALGTWIS